MKYISEAYASGQCCKGKLIFFTIHLKVHNKTASIYDHIQLLLTITLSFIVTKQYLKCSYELYSTHTIIKTKLC